MENRVRFWYNGLILALILLTAIPAGSVSTAHADTRDCAQLRRDLGWGRAEYRACRRNEIQVSITLLDAEFAQMRDWLRARGLDLNEAGHITDPRGRTLGQIEASNVSLETGSAKLEAGNAALRAQNQQLSLEIRTLDAEYRGILAEFSRTVLQSTD